MASFIWSGNTGQTSTPDQIERERKIADALRAPKGYVPKGPWSLLGGLAQEGAAAWKNKDLDAEEAAARAAADQTFAGLSDGSATSQEVIAALSNPWLQKNPGQSAVATALLQQNMDKADPSHQLDLQYKQAQIDALHSKDNGSDETFFGNPIPIETPQGLVYGQIGSKGGFKPIDIGEGNKFLAPVQNLNTGTGFTGVDKFGTPTGNVVPIQNLEAAQQTAVGKGIGEQQVTQLDAGRQAASNNAKLSILESTLSNAPQGAKGAFIQAAGQFGIPIEGLDDIQAATAIINQLVPLQRAPGSGTMSDADLALFKQSLPAIINQPGGNAKIIATLRAINDYTIAQADIERQAVTGQIDRATADRMQRSIPNPLANFNAATAPSADGWQDVGNGVRIREMGN